MIEIHQEQPFRAFNNRKNRSLITLLLFVFFSTIIQAQDFPFKNGEVIHYDIKYKYGLVTMKGGTANYKINVSEFEGKQTIKSVLDFKTTSFFDKIYKIRDTLISHASIPHLDPIYHFRSVNEGGSYSFLEEMRTLQYSDAYTEVSILRTRGEEIMVDTIISSDHAGYDLLNVFLFIRNLDYQNLSTEETRHLATFLGRRKVNIILRYEGQTIIEKSETHKFKALKFAIDVTDDVFTESSNALEVWISDDMNRIPLKMKAKLKIGAAEADMTSHQNLKYPLNSEIKIPTRK